MFGGLDGSEYTYRYMQVQTIPEMLHDMRKTARAKIDIRIYDYVLN